MRPPTYVATVKYGKEEFAEREIGDALYPLDPEIRIDKTVHRGVLAVYTKLNRQELLNALKANPPSALERIVPIQFCCGVNDTQECITKNMRLLPSAVKKIRFGRKGSLHSEGVKRIKDMLKDLMDPDAEEELLVEPLNSLVCFGIVRNGEDRFWRLREDRYTQIF